ncbi:hypothetical protein RNJ44_00594 [Nakaseomyces bracarensis]|uniref:Uncharacterized protein n=1 Tax=Nakaseomyces bracarensis TaxID=273131 RepID=A0ABR4NRP4_9SACH
MLEELLKELYDKNFPEEELLPVVICSQSAVELKYFELQCFEGRIKFQDPVTSFDYFPYKVDDSVSQNTTLELYALITSFDRTHSKTFSKILDDKKDRVKWVFLLDWTQMCQGTWMRYINNQLNDLIENGYTIDNSNIIIWCLNSNNIYDIQRNDVRWEPYHFDYLQQCLRSQIYYVHGSLVYHNSERSRINYQRLFVDLCLYEHDHNNTTNNKLKQYTEMVKLSEICIPFGMDSPELIQTIDENFDPSKVRSPDFIEKYYEKVIPSLELPSKHPIKVKDSIPFIDIQKELQIMYDHSKEKSRESLHKK